VGDSANRAPIQYSDVHKVGKGLCGDTQLRHQGSVHKALVGPRVIEHSDEFGLVSRKQGSIEGVMSSERLATPRTLTSALVLTDEPGLLMGR
jgi:hypothetical protein